MVRNSFAAAALVALAACGGSAGMDGATPASQPAPAQTPAAAPAQEAAPAGGPSLADGMYSEAQAERGFLVFRDTCSGCHGAAEFRGDDFMFNWEGSSVGRLYRVISRTMPDDEPGSLPTQEYIDVVSYILQLNSFPAGASDLAADEELLDKLTLAK